jgi:hypothetical protein
VERTESDNEDEGGDQGLTETADKPKLRMQRSFELLLKTGQIVRFEVCIPSVVPSGNRFLIGPLLPRLIHVALPSSGLIASVTS